MFYSRTSKNGKRDPKAENLRRNPVDCLFTLELLVYIVAGV